MIRSRQLWAINVQNLWLSNNFLSGTIPKAVTNLNSVVSLLLNMNILAGDLDGVFNGDSQKKLATVVFSNNFLTGPLPPALFTLPQLQVLIATSNCIQGPFPNELCGAQNLTNLIITGIGTATNCQNRFFPDWTKINSFSLKFPFAGGIPSCLLSLSSLEMLSMSSTGMTGTIPSDVVLTSIYSIGARLNRLTGTIPDSMQTYQNWNHLNLQGICTNTQS